MGKRSTFGDRGSADDPSSFRYISSLSMIVASTPEMNPRISHDEKDVAGTLAAFCLVAGLAGGSLLSFGVNWLVRGNPFG